MATKVNLKNTPTGFQTIIHNGRHSIIGDEPEKVGGTDLGFGPTEFLLSSLGACKVSTVRYLARKQKLDHLIDDVEAELSLNVKRKSDGSLVSDIHVKMRIDGDLEESEKNRLINEADKCYVHRLVEGDLTIHPAEPIQIEEPSLV